MATGFSVFFSGCLAICEVSSLVSMETDRTGIGGRLASGGTGFTGTGFGVCFVTTCGDFSGVL